VTRSPKKKIAREIASFPSIPQAAAKILAMLDNPNTSAEEIGAVLRYDAGLTANILKLTNSSYFGLPSKVASVRQALVLLGWKKLAHLIMTACVSAIMDKAVPGYGLPMGELWRHSIAVSVVAEGLAKELEMTGVDEIFTAALLHDVGKLVLGAFIKAETGSVDAMADRGISFEKIERKVFGTDHAEIGARILQNWSFPEQIISAVRWHHEPDGAPVSNPLIDIVHVANVLCLMIGMGVGREGLQYHLSDGAVQRIGLKEGQLEWVAANAVSWVEEILLSFATQFE